MATRRDFLFGAATAPLVTTSDVRSISVRGKYLQAFPTEPIPPADNWSTPWLVQSAPDGWSIRFKSLKYQAGVYTTLSAGEGPCLVRNKFVWPPEFYITTPSYDLMLDRLNFTVDILSKNMVGIKHDTLEETLAHLKVLVTHRGPTLEASLFKIADQHYVGVYSVIAVFDDEEWEYAPTYDPHFYGRLQEYQDYFSLPTTPAWNVRDLAIVSSSVCVNDPTA